MCGITGIVNLRSRHVDPAVLQQMNASLVRRGPDDGGLFFSDGVGLGHRRLSIIDLSTGHQPMTTEDGRYTVVFNGEIYNFLELRTSLELQGVRFKTRSDTEVLLELFAQKGPACLDLLNGMFAFAIWDQEKASLFLARDRCGKKPLYYALVGDHFVFASELKALLLFPPLKGAIDPAALCHFFTYECVPSPLSIVSGVQKLPAAHYLVCGHQGTSVQRYWNLPEGSRATDSLGEAEEKLETLLDKATAYRLIADVPVGIFLSGGIDSSLVVALTARHRAGKDIKTFAINFEDKSYDESPYSSLVAKTFGTDHHEETLSASRLIDVLPAVVDYMDEPFADGSILPTYLLSQFTRKHVTVALGGDGGDELFAGYPTFYASRFAALYRKLPRFFKCAANKAAATLLASDKNMSFDFKLRQFLAGADYPDVLANQVWLSAITPKDQKDLFTPDFLASTKNEDTLGLVGEEMAFCKSLGAGDRLLYFYFKFYMCNDILVKVDRASMANSLEVRAPFLDKDVVEYVSALSYSHKLRGLTTKYLLKRVAQKLLPKKIVSRRKKGFGIPVAGWLKKELKPLLLDTLNKNRVVADGLFCWPFVEKLIQEHLSGRRNNRKPLFALLVFHWWKDHFL